MVAHEILEAVLANFAALAMIPRPSGYERAVSDHLKQLFKEMGCIVVQDEKNNIIADLAASVGYEAAPRTILQGHMDMVCVAEEGFAYDPQSDPIRLVRTEEYLSAAGTSLGADNGAGVAEILYIFQNPPEPHGPLRAIITVDEEKGMTGAEYLAEKYLADADFYLNCDLEEDALLTIGSAGGLGIEYQRQIHWQPAARGGAAWKLMVSGLRGGHSGECINEGRGNAIQVLAQILREMERGGLSFSVSSIEGGTAPNAIPASAAAILWLKGCEAGVRQIMERRRQWFLASYGTADPGLCLSLTPTAEPARVMAQVDAKAIMELIAVLHSGVFAMSPALPGLVETSANLGHLWTADEEVRLAYHPRSSIDAKLESFQEIAALLGERFGFRVRIDDPTPAWQERAGSPLAKIVTDVFREQRGQEMRVGSIHAGLEVGFMVKKNPRLDAVSLGPTVLDIHSPRERLVLSTIVPQVELVCETLRRIAGMGSVS